MVSALGKQMVSLQEVRHRIVVEKPERLGTDAKQKNQRCQDNQQTVVLVELIFQHQRGPIPLLGETFALYTSQYPGKSMRVEGYALTGFAPALVDIVKAEWRRNNWMRPL